MTSLLRWNQRKLLNEDKARHEAMLKHPQCDDRGAHARSIRNITKMLKEQSPQPISGAEKDKIARRQKDLAEKISSAMVPREEMRRCPTQQTNAVYQHLRREGNAEIKRDQLEWKNNQILLNPESDDPNLANVDYHLRPEKGTHGHSGLMVDAMGPRGAMGYQSPAAQANFETALPGSPTIKTPLKAAQERAKGQRTPEQIQAAKDRMAKARAGKESRVSAGA